ncbi:hypothetical protein BAY61_05485 [Prauserella marina]|uniref:DUF7144 domain-containing protein n=1 Tax=Prauserella marina TaxID=530584 RepID=A0A222VL29_9PSEU|nr:hypothetical protein [Prauserella marina]ASR34532.1 hypothetical protein BAY61_05485 [Prauserella marina]PWV85861.1 hypothetical protein DES30_1011891 [Prauserella marina]SDC43692.1 hypothetical protein SAMN05421630_102101 [Prauserella marina]
MAHQDATHGTATREQRSGTAKGVTYFAGIALIVVGALQVLNGLAAIFANNFYLTVDNYLFDIRLTAWGWIHLALGALAVLVGLGVFAAQAWAYWLAILLVSLSIVGNFLFIPYYPLWSLLIIALDVWIIWALSRSLSASDMNVVV